MKQLAILGASGHGKVIADAALLTGWNEVFFFDDAWPEKLINSNWSIIGDTFQLIEKLSEYQGVVIGIGDCAIRWEKHQLLKEAGALLVNIIHPSSSISRFTRIGNGSVLLAGSVVNIGTELGEASIVNTGATVDHDCVVGNAVHIAPGAHVSGDVTIKDSSWIGVGAVLRQGIVVGEKAFVGAGAVVVKEVAGHSTVVGNPASELVRS